MISKMRCTTLKCPYREDWPDIENMTVGKEYDVEVLFPWPANPGTTQCEVTNDQGERMRILLGHFL